MPVKLALESLPIDGQCEVWAGADKTVGGGENCGGEGNGIAHGAPDPDVQFSDQGDVNERRPRDASRDSAGSGLHSGKLMMGDEVVRPLFRRLYCNRSYGNAIEPHYKFLYIEEI